MGGERRGVEEGEGEEKRKKGGEGKRGDGQGKGRGLGRRASDKMIVQEHMW